MSPIRRVRMSHPIPEDQPLLPCGMHTMTLSELRALCVEAQQFTLSTTRSEIMAGLTHILERLSRSWIVGEAWVDGSFLTKRIDPSDADLVVRVGGGVYNDGFPEQKAALDWIIGNQKKAHKCDSYPLFEYWPGHELFSEGEMNHALYKSRFGFKDRGDEGEFKGIAVIRLPEGLS
jgi:hypothetical protein